MRTEQKLKVLFPQELLFQVQPEQKLKVLFLQELLFQVRTEQKLKVLFLQELSVLPVHGLLRSHHHFPERHNLHFHPRRFLDFLRRHLRNRICSHRGSCYHYNLLVLLQHFLCNHLYLELPDRCMYGLLHPLHLHQYPFRSNL